MTKQPKEQMFLLLPRMRTFLPEFGIAEEAQTQSDGFRQVRPFRCLWFLFKVIFESFHSLQSHQHGAQGRGGIDLDFV